MTVQQQSIVWRLLVLGGLLIVIKLAVLAMDRWSLQPPSGFKRYRVPEANVAVFFPAPPEVSVDVVHAINDGFQERFIIRSRSGRSEFGVISTFRDRYVQQSMIVDLKNQFDDLELQVTEGCGVGVNKTHALEAVSGVSHGRIWIAYVLYEKHQDEPANSERLRHRFFRNARVYADDGREWILTGEEALDGCQNARSMLIAHMTRRR